VTTSAGLVSADVAADIRVPLLPAFHVRERAVAALEPAPAP
jgi:hypothetical protein